MRVLIVGAGVIGLLTAVECVAAGHEAVVLDRGTVPDARATSFDCHRTLRALHMDDPARTAAAVRAHHRWIDLQRLFATRFYEQVGTLTVLPPPDLERARALLTAAGSQAHILNPDELTSRYPHVEFPIGEGAVFESLAGVLLADKILMAAADWLRAHPLAELRPGQEAVEVDYEAAEVVLADGGRVSGDALLVAAGPWARPLLPKDVAEGLTLNRQTVLYCDVPALDAGAWAATPSILSIGADGCAWLVPPVAGTPLKLSAASSCRDAGEVAGPEAEPRWREHLVRIFAEVVPGFHEDWVTGAADGYYLGAASTDDAVVTMPGGRAAAFAACGGSSFKFAPLIARALSSRLLGGDPEPTGLGPVDAGLAAPTPAVHHGLAM